MSYFKDKFSKKIQLIQSFTDNKWDTITSPNLVNDVCENIHKLVCNKSVKYLDPSCGRGSFLVKLYELEFTKTYSNIESIEERNKIVIASLYGCEINSYYYAIAIESLKQIQKYFGVTNILNPNIYNCNYLNNKILNNMQFDVKIGNPPYQEISKNGGVQPKSHSLWAKFVVESLTSVNAKLKNNGYITFVTPSSWGSPSNEIFKLFKKNNLILVDTTISHHFKENSTFSYWIVQKSNYSGLTTINGRDFDLKNIEYLQSDINELSIKIHEIFNKSNHPKLLWESDTTKNHSSKKNEIWNKTKVGDYIYEVYHTNAQTYYSNTKSKSHDYLKVFLTLSGYYNPILDNGNISTSEVVPYIIVNSKEEGENLLSILNSKLYKYIVNSAKWSGFINKDILRLLPNIGLDRKWNDIDVYNEFGIKNKEEIDYIENYVG
jgi:hypothetical protein